MASVFFGWEFGGGLGHLTRLLPIARRLYDQGHDVTLAVRNIEKAKPVLAKTFPEDTSGMAATQRLRIVESAHWLSAGKPGQRKMPAHSLADAMRRFDYQRLPLLTKMAQTWSDLLDQSQPDLIVADFAPTLRLAHLGNAPFLMVGNGYTVPPPAQLLPPIRPWQEELQPFSRANEADILKSLNIVRHGTKGPRIDCVADVLNGDQTWIFTIPEFDPYQSYRTSATSVPYNVPDITDYTHTSERQNDPVLIYLPASHPSLKSVLAAVTQLDLPCHAYISHAPVEQVAKLAGANVVFHRKPLEFEKVLSKSRLIIHHAGLATAYAALKAGTPQLVIPKNLEHSITANGLSKFGVAIKEPARAKPGPEKVMSHINQLLRDGAIWDAAFQAAEEAARRPERQSLEAVVEACQELLGR